jgi:hypothetical protein
MVVCPGGSEKLPTSPDFLHVDPTFMAGFLPPAFSWLLPYVQYIAPLQLDVNALCSIEPPEIPSIDANDLWSLISRDYIGLSLSAGQKFAQLLHYIAWYKLCRCIDLTVPTMPTPPAAPSPLPEINPPDLVGAPSTAPCKSSVGTSVDYSPNNGLFNQGLLIAAGYNVTSVRYTVDIQVITPPGPNITVTWKQIDTFNADAVQWSLAVPLGHTAHFSYVMEHRGTATGYSHQINADATAGLTRVTPTTEVFCGGAVPGGTQSPCCPPDPIQAGQLQQILAMVTLLQRQLAPFATIEGVTHSGLTGSGEIAVQGLIGARVDFTVPPSFGSRPGDPGVAFDVGWLTWGDANGWQESERIMANPHRSTPAVASLSTKIGYTLNPGVTATIIELHREP